MHIQQRMETDLRTVLTVLKLYIHVSPAGGKLWRLFYRFDGNQKTLALGKYPEVSLAEARKRRDEARALNESCP